MNQSNRLGFAIVAIVLGSFAAGTVTLLAPGASAPGYAAAPAVTTNEEPFAYFPAQYVNQAKEVGPDYPTF